MYLGSIDASRFLFLSADLLSIAGFLIVVFATLELGKSIGISPANRGLVRTGIYARFRHPMYLGYVISEIGMVLLNPLNIALFIVSLSLYSLRAKFENKFLQMNFIPSDQKLPD